MARKAMLIEITTCKCEQREGRVFAVATAKDGSLWEYELLEAIHGEQFCDEILKCGAIRRELWKPPETGRPSIVVRATPPSGFRWEIVADGKIIKSGATATEFEARTMAEAELNASLPPGRLRRPNP